MQQATDTFCQLRYAAGTSETKDALFKTWTEILRARGMASLPVTEEKMTLVAAILRASGYKAGMAYLLEAKQKHTRLGYPWSEAMDLVAEGLQACVQQGHGACSEG